MLFPADYEGPVHIELTIPPQQLDVIMELQDADVISVEAVCSGVTYISQNAYMGKSTISDSIYTENKATISAYDVLKKGCVYCHVRQWTAAYPSSCLKPCKMNEMQ